MFAGFFGAAASISTARGEISHLRESYDFLVSARGEGGALIDVGGTDRRYALPLSFYDSADYWAVHVCQVPAKACAVVDTYDPVNYQLAPQSGPAGEMQTERVNTHNGANIYDAAVWQIAVVLGQVKNNFTTRSGDDAYTLATHLNAVLHQSGRATDAGGAPGTKRAVSVGDMFLYNGSAVIDAKRAYAFRTMAGAWLSPDPFMKTRFADLIDARGLPAANASYEAGKISWSDWKPITGENAWAFLLGPLQAAYLHYVVGEQKPFVPFKDLAVQNAIDVLATFAAMQSAVGGVYYAPSGTVGNQGGQPVNPHQISVENNFSLYAGLKILRAVLQAERAGETTLSGDDQRKIDQALRLIDHMIDGGPDDRKPGEQKGQTAGLLAFFRNAAWRDGGFVQGGLANDPAQNRAWVPFFEPKAVDVETWGIAALGAGLIDQWFGYGASFEVWQRLKTWGAYGIDKTLWGVGYSDQDGNGLDPSGAYKQGVMSAEWTAGAVNAVRNMIGYYGAVPPLSPHHADATKYLAQLKKDESEMVAAIQSLRIAQYISAPFPGKPDNYAELISVKTQPYLYASRRYRIPFGWFANPIPSTVSTAWVIMLANGYDPFGLGGNPN